MKHFQHCFLLQIIFWKVGHAFVCNPLEFAYCRTDYSSINLLNHAWYNSKTCYKPLHTQMKLLISIVCMLSTCGSSWICGSIWGLRKGNRHTLSPRLRWYSFPLAIRRILSLTTFLLIITAAVSRKVSLKTLSAERKGQESGWCQRAVMTG